MDTDEAVEELKRRVEELEAKINSYDEWYEFVMNKFSDDHLFFILTMKKIDPFSVSHDKIDTLKSALRTRYVLLQKMGIKSPCDQEDLMTTLRKKQTRTQAEEDYVKLTLAACRIIGYIKTEQGIVEPEKQTIEKKNDTKEEIPCPS
ncbi:hypothetical protein KKE60_05755 [Patescibacteria group bacterium]|nr:hypothetical protein [Patescibacteria group bacterium]